MIGKVVFLLASSQIFGHDLFMCFLVSGMKVSCFTFGVSSSWHELEDDIQSGAAAAEGT